MLAHGGPVDAHAGSVQVRAGRAPEPLSPSIESCEHRERVERVRIAGTEAEGGVADAGPLDPDSFGPLSSAGRVLPPAGPASFPGMGAGVLDKRLARMEGRDRES